MSFGVCRHRVGPQVLRFTGSVGRTNQRDRIRDVNVERCRFEDGQMGVRGPQEEAPQVVAVRVPVVGKTSQHLRVEPSHYDARAC
jgi:hypothetical protein